MSHLEFTVIASDIGRAQTLDRVSRSTQSDGVGAYTRIALDGVVQTDIKALDISFGDGATTAVITRT